RDAVRETTMSASRVAKRSGMGVDRTGYDGLQQLQLHTRPSQHAVLQHSQEQPHGWARFVRVMTAFLQQTHKRWTDRPVPWEG
ncbi:MAG: hypothetical protein NZ518_07125, partial [Dehalococcoidia bacterium]|nr:hypothetical protein [Dehalococcoidia bacterium]